MKYASAFAGAALALVCTAAVLPAQAAAPNYNAYCAQRFPGSVVTRHNATGELLCTVRSTYSLMHHQLNYAEACNSQYGSPAYRKIGPGTVDCTGRASGPGGANTRALSQADIQKYCDRFPGSWANYSEQFGKWICTERTHNGLGLLHRAVNLPGTCYIVAGMQRYQQTGRSVTCFG